MIILPPSWIFTALAPPALLIVTSPISTPSLAANVNKPLSVTVNVPVPALAVTVPSIVKLSPLSNISTFNAPESLNTKPW